MSTFSETAKTIVFLGVIILSILLSVFSFYNIVNYRTSFLRENVELVEFELNDATAPRILVDTSTDEFHVNHAPISVFSREPVSFEGFNGEVYEFDVADQPIYYYELVYPFEDYGEYEVEVVGVDASDNVGGRKLDLERIDRYDQSVSLEYIPGDSDSSVVINPRQNDFWTAGTRLTASFVPSDLVDLRDYDIPTVGAQLLRKEAAESFAELYKDLQVDGIDLVVTSAFRNFQAQTYTYNYVSTVEGASVAQEKVAIPGYSEHQLGLAIDVVNQETRYKLPVGDVKTKLYTWLQKNASKYGFEQTYTGENGFIEELWHWRYVGRED